ncbi:MAG: hypothetical protein QF600_11155 [Verrucomicrobiota bacterium]|jgi:hypothetical protein|nr:hypothetical protein [Verrucomicrobiota bacterium]|tara:strand:- start:480 stop:638 length:159 start_codon:yes stop_codon:yes gene_type:complete
MPFPKKPAPLSQSRITLSIGKEYWAIKRGNTLADKPATQFAGIRLALTRPNQ